MRNRRNTPQTIVLLIALALFAGTALAQGASALHVYDTQTTSYRPLTAVALTSPSRWTEVAPGTKGYAFKGDVVVMGDKFTVVFRHDSSGAELYTKGSAGWLFHVNVSAKGTQAAKLLDTISIASNTAQEVALDATYKTLSSADLGVRFRVRAGHDAIETSPLSNVTDVVIDAETHYGVLPSPSGEGLLLDADAIQSTHAEFTGEQYALQLMENGDAIVMSHWTGDDNSVAVNVTGSGAQRKIVSTELPVDAKNPVTTSVLAGRGLWRERVTPGPSGTSSTSVIWRWPAPGPWETGATGSSAKLAEFEARSDRVTGGGASPFAVLYDLGSTSPAVLSSTDMAGYRKWTRIAPDDANAQIKGDAAILNNNIAVVLRRAGGGAELYSRGPGEMVLRAVLTPLGDSPAQTLESLKIENNAQDSVVLAATYAAQGGKTMGIRYEVDMGQVFVKTQPLDGTRQVSVKAPCRFAVLPDFFADDIVIDAHDLPSTEAELPSENFLMQLLDEGKAMLITVWDNRDQEVLVHLSGAATSRTIDATEVTYGDGGTAWVAVLADPGIWHERDIDVREKDRVIPLAWQAPFQALWRVDWQRSDGLTDSWEMLSQTSDGKFKKHGLFTESEDSWTTQDWWGSGERTRIASGYGRFKYPCWVAPNGQGYLQPLKEGIEFQGPAVVYPINRLAATPLDKYTLVDVVRATLGVGPCQYILDVEGQQEKQAGWPTCTVRDVLDEIYEKNEQRQKRADVEQGLKNVVDFISLIRHRIEQYGQFAKDMETYLNDAKAKDAAHAAFYDRMLAITKGIDTNIEEKRDAIKSIEFAKKLTDDFRAQVLNDDSPDAASKCKEFTSQWVGIGGNQDELVAECRKIVKVLRQRAGIALAQDPSLAPVADEIRERTQQVLRSPVNYEAAHH